MYGGVLFNSLLGVEGSDTKISLLSCQILSHFFGNSFVILSFDEREQAIARESALIPVLAVVVVVALTVDTPSP